MKKLAIVLLAFSLSTAAIADHTVTMRTTFQQSGADGMKSTSVTRTKDHRQRIDDITEVSGFKIVNVRLIMCDLKQEAKIDPDAKVYTLRSMNPLNYLAKDGEPDPKKTSTKKEPGKVSTHVSVVDKGVEKVAQVQAHHWIMDTEVKTTGCIGDSEVKMHRELWTSDLPSFNCPILSGTWKKQTLEGGCEVTHEMTGDVELYNEVMRHEVVKEVIYANGKPQMTRELVDFSTAELDSSLFSVEGLQLVSEEQFQKVQTQKMMDMMMPGR